MTRGSAPKLAQVSGSTSQPGPGSELNARTGRPRLQPTPYLPEVTSRRAGKALKPVVDWCCQALGMLGWMVIQRRDQEASRATDDGRVQDLGKANGRGIGLAQAGARPTAVARYGQWGNGRIRDRPRLHRRGQCHAWIRSWLSDNEILRTGTARAEIADIRRLMRPARRLHRLLQEAAPVREGRDVPCVFDCMGFANEPEGFPAIRKLHRPDPQR